MRHCLLVALSLVGLVGFGRDVFVTQGGTGAGTTWADGASFATALANAADGDVIKVAKGVHQVSAGKALADAKVTIKGGYAGMYADEEPSGDRYETIITADADLGNVWISYDPETKTKEVVLEGGSPMKVIKDGLLNPPPDYTAPYQVYYPGRYADATIGDAAGALSGPLLTLTGTASLNVSNLTFSGFGTTAMAANKGSVLFWPQAAADGGTQTSCQTNHIRSVAFIGNAGKSSIASCPAANSSYQPRGDFTDVEVKFCRITEGSAFSFSNWVMPPSFTNCVVESVFGEGVLRTYPMGFDFSGRAVSASVRGGRCRRLVHVTGEVWSARQDHWILNENPNPLGIAVVFSTGDSFFRDFDIERCWNESNRAITMFKTGDKSHVRGVNFRENVVKIVAAYQSSIASSISRTSFGGQVYLNGATIFDSCQFVSNRLEVTTPDLTVYTTLATPTELYAATANGHGSNYSLFGDCVFADNTVDVSGADAETKKYSRSILYTNNKASGSPATDCLHCTFWGSAPGDDIVVTGTVDYQTVSANLVMGVYDSILWSEAHDYAYAGAVLDVEEQAADCLTVQRSIVKNAGLISGLVNFLDCTSDDPMLAYDPTTGVPTPTVGVAGAANHPQSWYLTVLNKGAYLFRNGCDMSTTNMFVLTRANPANKTLASPLISRRTSGGNYAINDTNVTLKPDLLGSGRPADAATAGAVETTFPSGPIVTASATPAGAGHVSIGSQYAGSGCAAVTATSDDPQYTFQKWVNEEGTTLSTSATYTPTAVGDYTRIKAVFGAPQVTWTFRTDGEKGRFAGGETTVEMILSPGDTSPDFPSVTATAAWCHTGWDTVKPAQVGATDMEFNATFIPYTKVVYFDSNATGANDGTSWTDAYTKLGTAIAAAGGNNSYVGEVRVRQGRHLVGSNASGVVGKFSNVRLIGGYTGSGDARSTDRHLTVFTGDNNDDDVFVDRDGNTVGRVYEDGRFITFREPTAAEGYWELDNYSDNYSILLQADDTVTCTNALIECLSFYGFYDPQYRFIQGGNYVNMTVTNCDFIGLHNTYPVSQGDIRFDAPARVLDCGIYGHTGGAFYLEGQTTDDIFEFRNVKYMHSTRNFAKNRMVTFINLNKGSVRVESCEFGHLTVGNYTEGTDTQNYGGPIIYQDNYTTHPSKPCWFKDCSFHDIHSPTNDRPSALLTMNYSDDASILDNCVFEDIEIGAEYKADASIKNTDIIPIVAKAVSNCVFRNVSFAYTGDAAGAKYSALVNVMDSLQGTTFENCRLSTVQNNYAYLVMSRGSCYIDVGGDTRFDGCSVTNLGTHANTGYTSAILAGKAVNMNSSPYRRIGPLSIRNCSVYAPNLAHVFLIDDINGRTDPLAVDGLTLTGNRVEGGTAVAALMMSGRGGVSGSLPTAIFRNAIVAGNTVVSDAASVKTGIYRPSYILTVGWSTFYNNDYPCDFYIASNYKMNMTSSVVTSEASGWEALGSSTAPSAARGIVFANSYVKGIDSTSTYFSGENAYETAPLMSGIKWDRHLKRDFVYHARKSPYVGSDELEGVYDADAATDARGVARPAEGPVLIGALQNPAPSRGMILLIK